MPKRGKDVSNASLLLTILVPCRVAAQRNFILSIFSSRACRLLSGHSLPLSHSHAFPAKFWDPGTNIPTVPAKQPTIHYSPTTTHQPTRRPPCTLFKKLRLSNPPSTSAVRYPFSPPTRSRAPATLATATHRLGTTQWTHWISMMTTLLRVRHIASASVST